MELTVRKGREYVHIILENDKQVIYYAKKYMKQGFEVYSICNEKTVQLLCKTSWIGIEIAKNFDISKKPTS